MSKIQWAIIGLVICVAFSGLCWWMLYLLVKMVTNYG